MSIEQDLIKISRYVEFSNDNFATYSIEFARILLSASAEIDVLLKQICTFIEPEKAKKNIDDYRQVITNKLKSFTSEKFFIDRYNLSFNPWDNWKDGKNPKWWGSYNNVKHHRNESYSEANLVNAINATGALLITVAYFYKISFSQEINEDVNFIETTEHLIPESSLIRLDPRHYKYISMLDKRNWSNKPEIT